MVRGVWRCGILGMAVYFELALLTAGVLQCGTASETISTAGFHGVSVPLVSHAATVSTLGRSGTVSYWMATVCLLVCRVFWENQFIVGAAPVIAAAWFRQIKCPTACLSRRTIHFPTNSAVVFNTSIAGLPCCSPGVRFDCGIAFGSMALLAPPNVPMC